MDENDKRKDSELKIMSSAHIAAHLPAKAPYGVTQKYDRARYDNPAAKSAAKAKVFGGKKTFRTPDGKLLYLKENSAKRRFPNKWAAHSAEADHCDALKNIYNRHKNGLFLTDEDIREIGNRSSNLAVISKSANTQKGAASDPATQIISDVLITGRRIENALGEFVQGARDSLSASAIPLVIRGIQNLVKVANNEISQQDALKDMAGLGVSIAASGGGTRVASFALSQTLSNSSSELIKSFAKVNQIGTILVVGSIVVGAAGRYLSGEINIEGFFLEISKDGVSLIGSMLASKAVVALLGTGAGAAALLAAMIGSYVCSDIYAQAKQLWEEQQDNAEIRAIANYAYYSMQSQRAELQTLLAKNHEDWAEAMAGIFQVIATGITSNDTAKTTAGLRQLLAAFNKEVNLYNTSEEALSGLMKMRRGTLRGLI